MVGAADLIAVLRESPLEIANVDVVAAMELAVPQSVELLLVVGTLSLELEGGSGGGKGDSSKRFHR